MLRWRCHFASWFNVGEIYKSYKVHHSLNPCNTAEKSFVNSTIHPSIHYQIWIKKKIAMYTTWGSQILKKKKIKPVTLCSNPAGVSIKWLKSRLVEKRMLLCLGSFLCRHIRACLSHKNTVYPVKAFGGCNILYINTVLFHSVTPRRSKTVPSQREVKVINLKILSCKFAGVPCHSWWLLFSIYRYSSLYWWFTEYWKHHWGTFMMKLCY